MIVYLDYPSWSHLIPFVIVMHRLKHFSTCWINFYLLKIPSRYPMLQFYQLCICYKILVNLFKQFRWVNTELTIHTAFNVIIYLQYDNSKCYCPDFVGQQEKVYRILVSNHDDNSVKDVLKRLVANRRWIQPRSYGKKFNAVLCNYSYAQCQLYTSLYRLVIKGIAVL